MKSRSKMAGPPSPCPLPAAGGGKGEGRKAPQDFVARAVELGAVQATLIPTSQVFTGEWVRLKCQYGCGGYASSRNCPPYSPTPERTRKILDEYSTAILVHGGRTTDIRAVVVKLEREVFLAGYHKAFAYACGPCQLCDKCDLEGACRRADDSRPAMEACGIDVFATARAAGLPIEVVTCHDGVQNYYGLVLVE